jgi:RimJ/RimL family protein N-acetyltransferase
MLLETERLLLRLPEPADAEPAGELLGDAEATRFIGGPSPSEAWPAIVEKWRRRWEANGVGTFVVVRRDDGRWLGRVGIIVWDTRGAWTESTYAAAGEFAQPELGWGFVRAAWGNGYATEAARAVRDWAGIAGLVSVIAPENVASQKVAARLGAVASETVQFEDTGDAVVWRY